MTRSVLNIQVKQQISNVHNNDSEQDKLTATRCRMSQFGSSIFVTKIVQMS